MSDLSTAILWHDDHGHITLLDIPQSIVLAQGCEPTRTGQLLSCEPLHKPFHSIEPKTPAAIARVQHAVTNTEQHQVYQNVLREALEKAQKNCGGRWCLPRAIVPDQEASGRQVPSKRVRINPEDGQTASLGRSPAHIALAAKPYHENSHSGLCEHCRVLDPQYDGNCGDTFIESTPALEDAHYPDRQVYVPASSYFVLGDCSDATRLHTAVRSHAQAHDLPRHFDLIVLDPPWPNRSVRRTHKTPNRTYQITPTISDVRRLLLRTDLDMLIAESGLVGIWITNKTAIRDLVLGENGIFATWGIDLIEEWIWLKVTDEGEPVGEIDALWRKPYEVFLLGRKKLLRAMEETDAAAAKDSIRLRTIIAVPDLHSRKPCLKELLTPLMPDPTIYRALEVFARHLVEGWWSWGNECTKFNHSDCWVRESASDIS